MAVACTESINLLFGSFILVPGTGIILNNTMDDFTLDATTPNAFGLRQSERNLVRPGARPLSSMSPTIVTKGDHVRLVVGASGGSRIISSTLQVLLNTLVGEQSVDDAVAAPRVHHQWLPDVVRHQAQLPQAMQEELRRRGHQLELYRPIGHVQAAERIEKDRLRAACDPDKGGRPAGQ
jgi:gamma-glutamyltranspeptidase/glutathione hydrolase